MTELERRKASEYDEIRVVLNDQVQFNKFVFDVLIKIWNTVTELHDLIPHECTLPKKADHADAG